MVTMICVLRCTLVVNKIWRLYVVFMCDWRVVIFPIILAVGCVGAAYSTTVVAADPNVGLYGSAAPDLIASAWVLDMILNVSVTVAIVWRLWWMSRNMDSLTATRVNRNAPSICVVIESGALSAAVNIVLLGLYASNSPSLVAALNVASQLVVCVHSPYLSRTESLRFGRL
jgi:phosphoglycerol transferase MdoB-like AlkP superfamily enzyme